VRLTDRAHLRAQGTQESPDLISPGSERYSGAPRRAVRAQRAERAPGSLQGMEERVRELWIFSGDAPDFEMSGAGSSEGRAVSGSCGAGFRDFRSLSQEISRAR